MGNVTKAAYAAVHIGIGAIVILILLWTTYAAINAVSRKPVSSYDPGSSYRQILVTAGPVRRPVLG
jgi:hypothetical protein